MAQHYGNSDLLSGLGVAVIDIAGDVAVTNPKIMTDKGAHAGMTIGQFKALYGSAFKVVKKTNYGVTQYLGSVKVGDRELMFRVDGRGDAHAEHPAEGLRQGDRDHLPELPDRRQPRRLLIPKPSEGGRAQVVRPPSTLAW
ncbi:hypothetical protein [Tessaracoccus flavescens]|uniref:Uncharacterized protein n=1 Tax=Tessaracoccus flavescens TaxID=399497 RepID=A0A1Q2CW92_9ACTN|nr:hypothetical protein [Tessaracoccus flavescens]AQP50375.1 hypothetical protein BW733_05575 [Tessaracoccus flavescens]